MNFPDFLNPKKRLQDNLKRERSNVDEKFTIAPNTFVSCQEVHAFCVILLLFVFSFTHT